MLYEELNKRLSIARELKDHKMLGDAYYDLALYEEANYADIKKSIDYLIRSRERYAIIQDSMNIYKVDRHLARRNYRSGLYQEALAKYKSVLAYYDRHDKVELSSIINYHISNVYREIGDIELEYRYLNKAITLNEIVGNTDLQVNIMLDQAGNYVRLNELDSALQVTKATLELSNQNNITEGIVKSLHKMGGIYKQLGNYPLAISYFRTSLASDLAKPYDDQRLSTLKQLADTYAKMDSNAIAYRYVTRYANLNDSILHQNRIEANYNYIQKYESLQKQKDIENLKIERKYAEETYQQQRRAVYILAIGLGMLLLLLYYIVRFYNQQIKTEKIITDQNHELNQRNIKQLQDDMQIRSMQGMIEGQEIERERIAQDLHDSLGGLLSTVKLQFDSDQLGEVVKHNKTFKRAHRLLDHAVTEVRNISQNLQPSALANLGLEAALRDLVNRFSDEHYPDIDLQCYDIPKEMNQMHSLSIYRVLQEMLHNAVKHSQAKEILIQINREGPELVIQFEDDGIGFDPENLVRKGMGLGNIRSRIDYLKGTVEMDSTPGEGTSYIAHVNWA